MSNEVLDAIRKAFDKRAATYDASDMHRTVAEAVAKFATLEGIQDVLDVATGTGLVVRALHARDPRLRLTGVDISPAMLAVAREAMPSTGWIEADVATLPLVDASVDLITCVTALHVIPKVDEAVAEWHRVLRPNGCIVTATFSGTDGAPSTDAKADASHRPYPRRHLPFRTIAELSQTAASYGFGIARHTAWTDGADTVLIAEWRRSDRYPTSTN